MTRCETDKKDKPETKRQKWRRLNPEKERAYIERTRLRNNFQSVVIKSLKKVGYKIGNKEIWESVPYNIGGLRKHLEALFEPWMNWDNYGAYSKSDWDDGNQATWRWSMDHIIPREAHSYSSPTDQGFKTCWALANIRPYSAKQNTLDKCRGYRACCPTCLRPLSRASTSQIQSLKEAQKPLTPIYVQHPTRKHKDPSKRF